MKQPSFLQLILLLGAGVILRLLFVMHTPVGGPSVAGKLSSYNDEFAHASYVESVLRTGRLPSQIEPITAPDALARGFYENYQPPLYYVIVAGICSVLDIRDMQGIIFTGRMLSVACFLLMAWVYIRICRILRLDGTAILAGLIFLSLGGVFVRFSSMLNNEALFWAIAGYFMYLVLRVEERGWTQAVCIGLTVSAILGLYTKISMLLLLPLPLILWARKSHRNSKPVIAVYLAIMAATIPLWLRNLHDFGALLPLDAGFGSPTWQIPFRGSISFAVRSFIFPWSEFWAGFVGVAAMLPFVLFVLANLKTGLRISVSRIPLAWAMALSLIGFVWLNFQYAQADARYVYSVWPVLCLLISGRALQPLFLWLWTSAVLLPYLLIFLPHASA